MLRRISQNYNSMN